MTNLIRALHLLLLSCTVSPFPGGCRCAQAKISLDTDPFPHYHRCMWLLMGNIINSFLRQVLVLTRLVDALAIISLTKVIYKISSQPETPDRKAHGHGRSEKSRKKDTIPGRLASTYFAAFCFSIFSIASRAFCSSLSFLICF